MNNVTNKVTCIRLAGWTTDIEQAGVKQCLFGELLKLAFPVVNNYHSDLYHDAMWIEKNLTNTDDLTFLFIVRENGTHLNNSSEVWNYFMHNDPTVRRYSVALVCDARGEWTLAVSES